LLIFVIQLRLFRYETLVAELDEMVEGGYIIPSADELQVRSKGVALD